MRTVSKKFFQQNTLDLAKSLIGKVLVHETSEGIIAGRIIETEAYLHNDPASHSFNGLTKRNSPMFNTPGTAYIYFTYGMYYCFNVVSNKKGIGEAVLIRALQPLQGIDIMKKNRKKEKLTDLCSGPAKLVIALGITKELNTACLRTSALKIVSDKTVAQNICSTKRIGISTGIDLPYRFLTQEYG